jgi:hypothetical protein
MRTPFLFALVLTAACGAHMSDPDGTGSGSGDESCATGTVQDPVTGQCVECLPGDDSCPSGQYCRADNVCVAGCDGNNDCGVNDSCCNHVCLDTTTLANCGACGNTCAQGEFCDGTQCNAPTYPNFCANTTVYVIHDGITADQTAADLMASTITDNCPSSVIVHTANQTDATLVDQTTGAPLAGSGVTYVFGGGPFANKPIKWLENTQAATKVYFSAPDGIHYNWMTRTSTTPVASMPAANCGAHADQFVTELVTDSVSGTLNLVGYGACSGGRGTTAAAYYYAHEILPHKASYPDSWYVFGWADTNNNSTPDAGDTFTILAHGV